MWFVFPQLAGLGLGPSSTGDITASREEIRNAFAKHEAQKTEAKGTLQ